MGVSDPGDEPIVFASDQCIVELVDDEYHPVAPGTPSTRVLVTNLCNLAQPLIRYELTDSFLQHPPVPEHGHLRATVEGRSDDVFAYGDVRIHPLVVRSTMVKTPEVVEYQVRQTARGVDIDVVAPGGCDESRLASRIASALSEAGLSGAQATVNAVPVIARHNETGKVRRFMPLA
jgi:phenylacetate-coenzyme A ligase PaaK-like adenylate-forming protein